MNIKARVIAFIVLFSIFSTSGIYMANMYRDINVANSEDAKRAVAGVVDVNEIPKIINVEPSVAYVGSEYEYTLRVSDSDSSVTDLSLSIISSPLWMKVERLTLFGTPTSTDVGTHKVVLQLTDGVNIVEKSFYLIVQDEQTD